MLWEVLHTYFVGCAVIVPGLLVWSLTANCPGMTALSDQPRKIQIYTVAIALIVGVLFGTLIAPFVLFTLFTCYRESVKEQAYWRKVQRTYYPVFFDPLHWANVEPELWTHIEQESEVLDALGFESLGEFKTKGEPFNTRERIAISHDGRIISEIGKLLDVKYCSLTSYLADGTVINSANCEPVDIEDRLRENNYHCICIPNIDMAELMQVHVNALKPYQECIEDPVVTISQDNYQSLLVYSHERFAELKFEFGKGDEPIESVFPIASRMCDRHESRPAKHGVSAGR